MQPIRSNYSWPVAFFLGAAGFVVGYFAPITLNPAMSAGPLVSFFTGPTAFLIGVALCYAKVRLGMRPITFGIFAAIAFIIVVAGTLYLSALP